MSELHELHPLRAHEWAWTDYWDQCWRLYTVSNSTEGGYCVYNGPYAMFVVSMDLDSVTWIIDSKDGPHTQTVRILDEQASTEK